MENIFELYKKFNIKERIKFDIEYIEFKKEEEKRQLNNRNEFVNNLNNIINEENDSYFSKKWVDDNILRKINNKYERI